IYALFDINPRNVIAFVGGLSTPGTIVEGLLGMPYAISMILFTWLVAASLCAPLSYFSVYEYKEDNPSMVPSAPDFCGYFCFEKWPSDDAKRIYGTSVLIVQFLIPLLIISFSYANIYLKLKTSINAKRRKSLYARNVEYQQQYNPAPNTRHGSSPQDDSRRSSSAIILSTGGVDVTTLNERQKIILKRQQRTNRMLVGMVVLFGVCLFWQVAYNCLVDYELVPNFLSRQPYFFGLA
uniref:G-protein coupled receptors family 1 profile domain-containing protein n=1 Tax=Romanomermis culicivorax TaxID=13658 RepID=A0A915KAK1_ROMCU